MALGVQAVTVGRGSLSLLFALRLFAPEVTPGESSWLESMRSRAGDEPLCLVQRKSGEVFARTPSGKVSGPLLPKESRTSIYDGGYDLLWVRERDQLSVVDLREKRPALVAIARGLPVDIPFVVTAGTGKNTRSVRRPLGCEVDAVVDLRWSGDAMIEIDGKRPEKPRIIGSGWFETNFLRDGERPPELADFGHDAAPSKVKLPATIGHCLRAWECGKWLPFGADGTRLVLTGMEEKDRCRHHQCLLFDPKTKLFASPVAPTKWGKAEETPPSSCGPFAFDSSGHWYLAGDKVCSVKNGCTLLDGEALGWLSPGALVGEAG